MTGKRMPRWPLFLIALPAAVAVWSGWVGLGQLCGFGIIHPLPGIWDAAHLNTAITLPVGVEAYGAYALGAWLTPGTPGTARKFARRSAIGSLVLGMAGQVCYHLLSAAHATRAPWPVVVLVSSLPVVVLGFGAALSHLLREPGDDVPATVTIRGPESARLTVAAVPGDVDDIVPGMAAAAVPVDDVPPTRARRAPVGKPKAPESVFARDVASGTVPSIRQIKTTMRVGTPRAQAIRDDLAAMLREAQSEAA